MNVWATWGVLVGCCGGVAALLWWLVDDGQGRPDLFEDPPRPLQTHKLYDQDSDR